MRHPFLKELKCSGWWCDIWSALPQPRAEHIHLCRFFLCLTRVCRTETMSPSDGSHAVYAWPESSRMRNALMTLHWDELLSKCYVRYVMRKTMQNQNHSTWNEFNHHPCHLCPSLVRRTITCYLILIELPIWRCHRFHHLFSFTWAVDWELERVWMQMKRESIHKMLHRPPVAQWPICYMWWWHHYISYSHNKIL